VRPHPSFVAARQPYHTGGRDGDWVGRREEAVPCHCGGSEGNLFVDAPVKRLERTEISGVIRRTNEMIVYVISLWESTGAHAGVTSSTQV